MLDEEVSARAYSSIQETQLKYWEKIRHPFVAGLELTPICNLRCVHCYMGDYPHQELLSAAQWKQIIDKLYDAGVLILYITGGEILTRRDFPEIYTYAKQRGFIIELLTNITLLTDEIVEMFQEYPPATISISLYGTHAETYEKVTGVKGSFQRFLSAVEKLCQADLDIELKFIGIRENISDFQEAEAFAGRYHAKFKYNLEIFPTLQGSCDRMEHRLSCEEIIAIEASHEHTACIYANNIRTDNPFSDAEKVPLYTCNVASTLCYIDAEGFVSPCNKMRLKEHNLLEESLSEIWRVYIREYAYKIAPKDYKCAKCPHIHLCSPCPVINSLTTGDPAVPSEENCRLIALRTAEFSKEKYRKYKIGQQM